MVLLKQINNQIRPYMKERDYKFSNKCFYKISNDMAYCIQFDMPGGLLYATFYVMPLYIPCHNRYYTYGNRVNALKHSKLTPLTKDAQDKDIVTWCNLLCDDFENFVFPFFEAISSPQKLVGIIEGKRSFLKTYFACPEVQIYRLQLFSYLYTCEFAKLSNIIKDYQNIIRNSYFLSDSVRKDYLYEIESALQFISADIQYSHDFCEKTVEVTLQKCFK